MHLICGTPAFLHKLLNIRFTLRGSIGPPLAVVNTGPVSRQEAPAAALLQLAQAVTLEDGHERRR